MLRQWQDILDARDEGVERTAQAGIFEVVRKLQC